MSIYVNVEFVALTPGCCGRTFALPAPRVRELKRTHETFWCPNCQNPRHYPGESDLERLEREAKWANESRGRALKRAESADRRARAFKGHLTRTKRRVANGVCPCCGRTFAQLARHMKTQHPEYDPEGSA